MSSADSSMPLEGGASSRRKHVLYGDDEEMQLSDASDMGEAGEDEEGDILSEFEDLPDTISQDLQVDDAGEEKLVDNDDMLSVLDAGYGSRKGWGDMEAGCRISEVLMYSIATKVSGSREAASVLQAAFLSCVPDASQSIEEIVDGIADASQYTV